jgi:hypothetical protein
MDGPGVLGSMLVAPINAGGFHDSCSGLAAS